MNSTADKITLKLAISPDALINLAGPAENAAVDVPATLANFVKVVADALPDYAVEWDMSQPDLNQFDVIAQVEAQLGVTLTQVQIEDIVYELDDCFQGEAYTIYNCDKATLDRLIAEDDAREYEPALS